MQGISRGRGQLLRQFPPEHVARRGDSHYYEKVVQYSDTDQEMPNRIPPARPDPARVKRAIEREAERFIATNPGNLQGILDYAVLRAPMEARTDVYPATFYCLQCGRLLHVKSGRHGVPPPTAVTKEKLRQFTRDRWMSQCKACGGQVEQWRFLTIHWSGEMLSDVRAWNIQCNTHGTDFLRLSGMHNPTLAGWSVRCTADGCDYRQNGLRGANMSKANLQSLPEELRKGFVMVPVERSGNLVPRVVTVPLATRELVAPTPGSSAAQDLIVSVTGGAGAGPRWNERPSDEVRLITDYMAKNPGTLPEDAESALLEMGLLSAASSGTTDSRASDPDALEQAAILRALLTEGHELSSGDRLHSVHHHARVPVSSVLYGYTRVGFDPSEAILNFYMAPTSAGTSRAQLYYHTGPTEALTICFDDPTHEPTKERRIANHTMAHALIRAIGEVAGFGETSLTEYPLDRFGAVAIMPVSGQDLVLNLLLNAWEQESETIIARAEELLATCPADTFCWTDKAACAQCVVLPWHCCGQNNQGLDRRAYTAERAAPAGHASQ